MLEIGVDIGGTFVDVVCLRDKRAITHVKVSTTASNLVEGVITGVERLMKLADIRPADVARIVHGSTVATNAIIERRSSPIGILMTDGFEDTLEIGRQKRSRMYDLFMDAETPAFLSPRRMRRGISERMDAKGQVVIPLNESAVRRTARELIDKYGIRAFAVCYLFSFRNDVHEVRTREILREIDPRLQVSLSSEVDPTFREYERLCLTAFDAYLKPVIGSYLVDLEAGLAQLGINRTLQVMQSRGAIITSRSAVERPVSMFLSGPAAGVVGGTYSAAASSVADVISMDMGGTSNDVSVIRHGKPLASSEKLIMNYPVRVPMVDVSTIGAGGGSIAWIDSGDTLKVGPKSAGADPGPVCYGRGGTEPTVTDSGLVLGYLPAQLGGGSIQLNPELSKRAISSLGRKLGLDEVSTASGIQRIVNANMAEQIRLMSVKRGYDVRKFGLVVLGGGGPVHGAEVARLLGINKVIVPCAPGVLSAFGLLVANIEHHHARSTPMHANEVNLDALVRIFGELEKQGDMLMRREGAPPAMVEVGRLVEMRYVGQSFELEVPLDGDLDEGAVQRLTTDFHERHQEIYGYSNPDQPVEILTLRVMHTARVEPPVLSVNANGASFDSAHIGSRSVWWPELGWKETPVFDRLAVPVGEPGQGPAILEQTDTTTVVPPDCTFTADARGNLIIEFLRRGSERREV